MMMCLLYVSIVHSPIQGSDDDESTFRVGPARRGCASQVQVPEPINREWIYNKDGEFSNQGTSTRIIGSILRALWSGPWDSWKDVPNEHKRLLFERFQVLTAYKSVVWVKPLVICHV
ncbi:hypothetical protein Hanom_Chr03g00218561 [Helianthus anomalus]